MKPIKRRALEAILTRRGCRIIRSKGEHDIWQCRTCTAPVPRHGEIAPGTLRSIVTLLTPCLGQGWLDQ